MVKENLVARLRSGTSTSGQEVCLSAQSNHTTSYIGQRLRRVEDPRLLTGGGRYASDLALPGMVHLALLRSPHAHARIGRIDTRRTAEVRGVIGVFTAADLPEIMTPELCEVRTPGTRLAAHTPLASDVVRYVGEPVAVVVAEDRYAAEDGAATIERDNRARQ
jgi:aerobic carbon-monoxide dehydrogenase large subunit